MNELIFNENLFLIILGIIWIIGAILQDFKRREVDNIWNFSLIIFALVYRLLVAIFISDWSYFFNGLIGLGIFFVLSNIFYYGRLFAGGDSSLLFALGPILTLSSNWILNFKIYGGFIFLFLVLGSIYSLIYSFVLALITWKFFKKEFKKNILKFKTMIFFALGFSIIWALSFYLFSEFIFSLLGILVLIFPFLFIYAKSIENCCMIKLVSPNQVTEGDWLNRDIKIGKRVIRANWEGISRKDLIFLQRNYRKKVWVKYGVPFTPSFLFGLIGLIWILIIFN